MDDFYALFVWETPVQQTWRQYLDYIAVPYGSLMREYVRKFPTQPWPQEMPIQFFEIQIPDTAIKSSDGARAESSFRQRNGSAQTLHLIKQQDRWWISGYSIERAASIDSLNDMARKTGQSLETLLTAAAQERQGVLNMTQRLKSGQIQTIDQFWQAASEYFGAP